MEPSQETARLRFLQWVIVACWIASFTVLFIMDYNQSPDGRRTPWGCAAGFLFALAHGIWITLDARILGRRVGAWRFASYFLGPLVIWAWMLTAYRAKALFLIPVSVAIYALPVAQVLVAEMVGLIRT